MLIETIQDYLTEKDKLENLYVQGKKHKILITCANTFVVNRNLVQANTYNPNSVPDSKMQLLLQSIIDNGFCFPIVTLYDEESEIFVVIDGFHRLLLSYDKYLDLPYIPIVVLQHNVAQRMIATIQFNKARGVHQVDLDAEVIRALIEQGLSEDEISNELGIDLETVYRYKQITGIAELFKNTPYSKSWEIMETQE
jgi:ParB-like chromosome segregation protein Spo0J